MHILYIYDNERDKKYENHGDALSLYCLNTGKLIGDSVSNINDHHYLNEIATNNVEPYSEFVYTQNDKFIEKKLLYKNKLSLYFLTDFSCKRTEIFSTYSDYCNTLFLRNYLLNHKVEHVVFDGCKKAFVESVKSIIGRRPYTVKNQIVSNKKVIYVIVKNSIFYLKLVVGVILRRLFVRASKKPNQSNINQLYLTRYPLHLDKHLYEDKYGEFVDKSGVYLVNLFTDGLHQNLSLSQYLKSTKFLSSLSKVEVLDDYLSFLDVTKSFIYSLMLISKFRVLTNNQYCFNGVNLTSNIVNELHFSLIRIPRLLMWEHSIERFTKYNKVSTLYYYLHEYSYGRMITFMFKSVSKKTRMIGFQHGPSSMRKMVYMAAKKELSTDGDGIKTFPVPDEILSEDVFSKYIYTKAGYKNVEIMKKIYRLSYLNKVNRTKYNPDSVLIAPGLHDGKFLLNNLHSLILKDKDTKYILKPHPRANNGYIDSFLHINNLTITNDKVLPLLSMVGKVYATYSSVAIEAHLLGIDIEIVEMPGKINESPLIDASFLKSAKNIRY